MFPRTRSIAAAALLTAAALYLPGHLHADQDDAQARVRGGAGNAARRTSNLYIVQMAEQPVVSYTGGIAGQPATKPNRGQKIDSLNAAVVGYAGYLDARHDQALAAVGGARKVYDYHYSFHGFAAELSDAQAAALRATPAVLSVSKDEEVFADTSSTPTFLGLNAPGGLWDQLGGTALAGDEIIVGVIDSGIWPESESFSDRASTSNGAKKDGKKAFQQIPGWHGKCGGGEQFPRALCNQKLIGAQHFDAAWGGDAGLKAQRPWEFASARDYNGHGTHTSSTAAGNAGVATTGAAAAFGPINGMAPHARVAMYKALWSTQDGSTASGFTSDLVAAIDQAVADGVDVINYSISGTRTNFLDPAQVAFLFAADAGVFVSASAGNDGVLGSFTVAHPGPWLTTVAAGTHNRDGQGSVTLGGDTTFNGASVATAFGPAPLIDATAAGLPGATPDAVRQCFAKIDNGGTPALDPAKIAGKIVICDRGTNPRVNKSLAVQEAGGVGMIMVNVSPNSINADFHVVPSVHLQDTDRAAVKAYAATAKVPTATINQSTIVFTAPAPFTASFSSRGPLLAGGGDLLKPDVIAPGQDILAAVAPPGNGGRNFNLYSGTSMSAPHVAGIAALLKQLHPDWSPMMIKSALMTSATDILDGPNTNPLVIFRQGAGHIAPNRAADPGLVYDAGFNDWLAFLCGTTTGVSAATCNALAAAGYSFDPSNLNVASIAVGDLAGAQTITRRVTNVGRFTATYNATVTGMGGFAVSVNPASLTIQPKETKSYTVTFTRGAAALNNYRGGQLTWSDGLHSVRSPLVVNPVALAAPASVFSTGGAISYNVKFGYAGPFLAAARGLVPAVTTTGSIQDDPGDSFSPTGPGVVAIPVTIPAGTTHARFSTFDADVPPGSDIDLYVFKGATQVDSSGGGTTAEEVNLLNPAAGDDYIVYVHAFNVTGTVNFKLYTWLLGGGAAGNMTLTAPTTATVGGTGTINLTFGGLMPGTKYLGSVAYSGSTGMPDPTIVRVDP